MSKMKLLCIGLMIMAILCWPCTQAQQLMTLRDAILLSIRYNPNIQTADLQRIIDKYNLRVAQYQFEIQYALNVSTLYTNVVSNGIPSSSDTQKITHTASLLGPYGTTIETSLTNPLSHSSGQPRYYNPAATVVITQPLMRGFGRDVTLVPLYNAEDTELINQLTLKSTAIAQITSVINQYVATVQAANTVKAQKISLKQLEDDLQNAKLLVKAGKRGAADLIQFEANASSQKLSLQQQQVAYEQARAQLLLLIGIEPTAEIHLSDTISEIIKKMPSLKESISIALAHNPSYQQALINIRVLKRNVVLAEDNIRPQLNLSVSQTQGGGSGGSPNSGLKSLVNGSNHNTTVNLSLNVPISTVPQEQAIANSKVALQQALVNLAALKRQTILNVQVAYETLMSQKQQVIQALNAVELAQKNYNISKIKLKYGRISAFEVSSLQTALTNANFSYVNTFASYVTSQANFDSILGMTTDRWNLEIKY